MRSLEPRSRDQPLAWLRLPTLYATAAASKLPAVYAIGVWRRAFGLPHHVEWVYVGVTGNLQRRLGEHHPARETNPGLQAWLLGELDAELWYAHLDRRAARRVEAHLIQQLRPKFNRAP